MDTEQRARKKEKNQIKDLLLFCIVFKSESQANFKQKIC